MSFIPNGGGSFKQEVSYMYVGRGGDFTVEPPSKSRHCFVMLCSGAGCLLLLLVSLLVLPWLGAHLHTNSSSTPSTQAGFLKPLRGFFFPEDSGDEIHYAPNGQPYPEQWGEPPAAQTMDIVYLPLGFGQGSSSLARWISVNVAKDGQNGIYYSPDGKEYPREWGEPPTAQTMDLVPLPGGYGQGSSTLADWIQQNLDADEKDGHRHYSPNGKAYPKHWGTPPVAQTMDRVRLPYGYGFGSSTEAGWIQEKVNEDKNYVIYYAPSGAMYPHSWGAPPVAQTMDRVPLPGGFGYGSSTLATWIRENMARQALGDDVAEFCHPSNSVCRPGKVCIPNTGMIDRGVCMY
jgi:hypothetical protein